MKRARALAGIAVTVALVALAPLAISLLGDSCNVPGAYASAVPGETIKASGCRSGFTITRGNGTQAQPVSIDLDRGTIGPVSLLGVEHVVLRDGTIKGRLQIRAATPAGAVANTFVEGQTRIPGDVTLERISGQEILARNVDGMLVTDFYFGGYDVCCGGVPKIGGGGLSFAVHPARNIVFDRGVFHDITRKPGDVSHVECAFLDGNIDGIVFRRVRFHNCSTIDFFCQDSSGLQNKNVSILGSTLEKPRDNATGAVVGTTIDCKGAPGSCPGFLIGWSSIDGNIAKADCGPTAKVIGSALTNTSCPTGTPPSSFSANVATKACGPTDKQADPGFMTPTPPTCANQALSGCPASDFSLVAGSPAIGAAPPGAPSPDIFGTPRPDGVTDAGAIVFLSLMRDPDVPLAISLLRDSLSLYFVGQLGYTTERAQKTRAYRALVALGGTWP